ncbi:sugar nucleotide-binding protein [Ramlibacter sp. 2FC]|uniref:sugar nucleotide-binding protein n=1 Tax=Ramlibacter sp. 2FC TaxID=2502188 RepID=UPI00201DE702|nr:sugar nucleotide-binding protein [Ramlibacter sp. 2FC]
MKKEINPDLPLKVRQVGPAPSSACPAPAKRLQNSRLETAWLRAAFGLHLPPWQQGVDRMLEEVFCIK